MGVKEGRRERVHIHTGGIDTLTLKFFMKEGKKMECSPYSIIPPMEEFPTPKKLLGRTLGLQHCIKVSQE